MNELERELEKIKKENEFLKSENQILKIGVEYNNIERDAVRKNFMTDNWMYLSNHDLFVMINIIIDELVIRKYKELKASKGE